MIDLQTLHDLSACAEACEWAGQQPSLYHAWRTCERADWMLWLLTRLGLSRERIVLIACEIARTALKHVRDDEDRPRLAIEAAEAWTRGECDIDTVRAATYDADAAAYASDDAYGTYAADAIAHAAYVAYATDAHVADTAHATATNAADAAYAPAAARKQYCRMIRRAVPYREFQALYMEGKR